MSALEETITAVAARCVRSDVPIDRDTPFSVLGLDSLATIELAAGLETALGCDLPAEVFAECHSVRTLAARLGRSGSSRPPDAVEQMLSDAVLPADVRPLRRLSRSADLRNARTILVTGGTGFLGAALVHELIAGTSAALICLARPGRLLGAAERIRWVEGDLAQARLGVDEDTYERLVSEVDAVIHCAAAVNWVFSYGGLRSANVAGTTELLRLACLAGASFHFVSSLSVCYAHGGPARVDEGFDGLGHIRQVHLGYAQTKIVGEALVRQAAARGLRVRIYRPALISGHSVTGAYNRDDLIATLVRGCVAMGAAPDLDWMLDAVPVDVVASAILGLSKEDGSAFHIAHPRPRHWRECVLWMRMSGYDVRLVSYAAWLRQLETDVTKCPDHPLRPLRSFFTDRPASAGGLTVAELYENRRRTRADSSDTHARLLSSGVHCPPLDANLLDTYFAAFVAGGDLAPATVAAPRPHNRGSVCIPGEADVEILSTGSDHSIISELTAWRSGRPSGLFRARVTERDGRHRDVMLKVKARDQDVMAVGEAIADVVDRRVAGPYRRWRNQLGLVASHEREIAIYRQQDARFLAHTPRVFSTVADETTGIWLLVQEHIADARLLDSANEAGAWAPEDIDAAIEGLAALHSIWLGRDAELRVQPWIGHIQSAATMGEMGDLWMALAEHALPCFSSWVDPHVPSLHRRLAARASKWWLALETAPRTLIHGDFNPRNICLRGTPARLCAYDWELATLGVPQRDLAEFLCFVLSTETIGDAAHWVERHRQALAHHAGVALDQSQWMDGFRAAVCDLLVNRLAVYTMIHRIKPQPFLPRIVRTWSQLARISGCEALA